MAGMPPMSFSAGGGGPSGSSSNAGVEVPIANPFNFDHSGWVVNNHSDGNSTTATGNKDANQTSQTGRTAGLLDGLGLSQPMLIAGAAVVAYVLLKR